MKQLILSLLVLFTISLSASAQKHMSYMNIPIDGTIESFHQKLIKTGKVTFDRNRSKNTVDNVRIFRKKTSDGIATFVSVAYNPQNKMVYAVHEMTIFNNEAEANEYWKSKFETCERELKTTATKGGDWYYFRIYTDSQDVIGDYGLMEPVKLINTSDFPEYDNKYGVFFARADKINNQKYNIYNY